MKYAAKLIKDRLAELGIPRRAIVAVTGANGVGMGHSFDPKYRDIVIANADRLAEIGDLGLVIGRYSCGCVFKALVTTDPRHRGKVTQTSQSSYGHECATEAS